jgi:Mrp family chromosome partitioning ATPase
MHAQSGNGLYDVLTGAIPLGQTFVKDSRSDAFVLAMNKRPPNLSAMFASGQMARLISILRDGCDMVVIDCGRAGSNPDAALLARLADATVLVSRAGALYAPSLANAVRVLTGAKAAPVGLVVTK